MNVTDTTRFTERIQFFDGQRLFASDLQDVEEFNRQMRWLHHRSLHQSGVADGYAVFGKKDDREIIIEPGYAVDSMGREIVLTRTVVLQVPPVASDAGNSIFFDLTVSYPSDKSLTETETRDGVCASRAAVRLRDEPVFCWIELVATGDSSGESDRQAKLAKLNQEIESGERIRLARAEVLNCKLNSPPSLAGRRNAKPPAQPFIYAGRTSTPKDWNSKTTGSGITISLDVDVKDAQFRTPPRYFAHAVGDRELTVKINSIERKLVLDGFSRVDPIDKNTPLTQKFRFSLLIPAILFAGYKIDDVKAGLDASTELKDWYVEWLGIE